MKKTTHHRENIEINQWFDKMVSDLRMDEILLELDLLEKQKKDVYQAMVTGDEEFVHNYARKASSTFFIKNIINSYFIELFLRKGNPRKIALDLSNSKILVWAEIENDDEKTENALILTTAKINHTFSEYGFHVSTTIVEKEDNLEIPNHYKEVAVK